MNYHKVMKENAKDERLPRHSGSGRSGFPRKNGHGKFGWGTPGCEVDAEEITYEIQVGILPDTEGEDWDVKELKERELDLEDS